VENFTKKPLLVASSGKRMPGYHGLCAEIESIAKAMKAGENLSKGKIRASRINGFNHYKLCPSCQAITKELGITK
jgi:hypothetical protein